VVTPTTWARGAARLSPEETGRRLALPAEHLLVVRVLSGWLNILAQLNCTVDVRGLAEEWVPGFAAGRVTASR
jgi:hypothetical protein